MWLKLTFAFGILLVSSTALKLPEIPNDFNLDDAVLSDKADAIAQRFDQEYRAYMETGIESPALQILSSQLAQMHSERDIITKDLAELEPYDQFFACVTCRATIGVVIDIFRNESSPAHDEEVARQFVLDVCIRFRIYTTEVCMGMFDSHYEMFKYITMNTVIDSRTFCSLFLQFNFCNVVDPGYTWTLNIDGNGTPVTGPKSTKPTKGTNDLRILHLTDIHHDPLYEPGSLAECEEPQCCQRNKTLVEGTSRAAGYWGDYRDCDSPWHVITNALSHIKSTNADIDYIYQTGDVVDHMVWATSREKNTEILTKIYNELKRQFPGVNIYSAIGNHESHPLNVFSPPNVPEQFNTKWLYELMYDLWKDSLPEEAKDTVLKGGYYTALPKPGFRIIGLNSMDCFSENFWLFYNGTDKIPQLEWLHDTLLQAEKNSEYVHILSHIPSGDGTCWNVWSREYNRIVERFRNTISAIFNGHSHKDEMNVHYSSQDWHPISISWNGGSFTPGSFKNPNYRFYDVEQKTFQVVDHETWIYNLTEANIAGADKEPVWFKEYSFVAEYTDDLSPAGIDKLLDKMADEPEILRKFWRFKLTNSNPLVDGGCDHGCLRTTLCRIATTVNDQKKRCNELLERLDIGLDNESGSSTVTAPTTQSSTAIPTTEDDDDDDGAASLVAFKISSILALCFFMKYIL